MSVRTASRILERLGLNQRRFLNPPGGSKRIPGLIRARWPSHMVHVDVKKVGRIPDWGGWRAHGRSSTRALAGDRAKAAGRNAVSETEALASVEGREDSYDHAMAEAFNSPFKAELIHKGLPWKGHDDVAYTATEYIAWYSHRGLKESSCAFHTLHTKSTTTVKNR